MGVTQNISMDTFPKQGPCLHKEVDVAFNYQTSHTMRGRIVRDDYEDPWQTIIALADGRYVLATECQYSVP